MNKFNSEIQNCLREFFGALLEMRPGMTDMSNKLVAELDAEVKNPDVFLPSIIDTVKEAARVGLNFSSELRRLVQDDLEMAALVDVKEYTPELKARLDDDVVLLADECIAFKIDAESEMMAKHGGNGDPFYNYLVATDRTEYFYAEMSKVAQIFIDKAFKEVMEELPEGE